MENSTNQNKRMILLVIGALAVAFGGWYFGYGQGRASAIADIKAQQIDAGNKAAATASDEANPFKVENPLQGVEANPFEKAKKTLNPFD